MSTADFGGYKKLQMVESLWLSACVCVCDFSERKRQIGAAAAVFAGVSTRLLGSRGNGWCL